MTMEAASVTKIEPIYEVSKINSTEKSMVLLLGALEQIEADQPNHPNIEAVVEIKTFLKDCLVDIRSQKRKNLTF